MTDLAVKDPATHVAGRIRDRYDNPARRAYTYLFRLRDESGLKLLVPPLECILTAWVDEGNGLQPLEPAQAEARCAAAGLIRPHQLAPAQLTPHQRRQMMARVVLFTAEYVAEDPAEGEHVVIQLASRALGFSPKGDRESREIWKRAAGDYWYSAYRPDDDETDQGDDLKDP